MSSHAVPLKIDFVSDVSCPWCAIGLYSLEQAIARIGDAVQVEIDFQPFELNPHMPAEGQDATEHLVQKYGSTPGQLAQNREVLRARGEALGFTFNQRNRIYNTFDAHRLLHWAGLEGADKQLALKHKLLHAYFTDSQDVSSHDVLVRLVSGTGLDEARARQILGSAEYATDVRRDQQRTASAGIRSVPAVIINSQYLISGGQPVEAFEQALRQIAGLT